MLLYIALYLQSDQTVSRWNLIISDEEETIVAVYHNQPNTLL